MSKEWDQLAELPIEIESYELTGHDREYGDFTRPSTVVHLKGKGEEGIGEDVIYDVLDHIAQRDAGPVLQGQLTAPTTLGEACELLGELDLFNGTPPEREPSQALPPLGLRVGRARPRAAPERRSRCGRSSSATRSRFASSARPGSAASTAAKSSTEPIRKRLERYPGLEFKLDPENDWDEGLINEIARDRDRPRPRPQGLLQGHPGRRRHRSRALRRRRREVPGGLPRGPRPQRRDDAGARAVQRPRHVRRAAALARRREGDGAQDDQLEAVAVWLAPGAARDLRVLRAERDRGLQRRPGRGRVRTRPDPVPLVALSRLDAQRHRPLGLQRSERPSRDADEPDGPGAFRYRLWWAE